MVTSPVQSFRIREAGERDLDQLLGLYGELAEGDAEREPAPAETSREVLIAILADRSRHLCVATEDDDVVGSAKLIVVPKLSHRATPWAVVENVIVTQAARGRGAGRALLAHLVDLAGDRGCYQVQLHSGKQRRDAHRLYRAVGFEPVAEGFKLDLDGTSPASPSAVHGLT